jgi:dephospho-CoA kinase
VLRIGLTGNAASGKSTVAEIWAGLGASLLDADVLARAAVAPGSPGLDRVRREFGDAVVTEAGVDRAALRRIVFDDPSARRRLEEIVHPEVARLRQEEESRLEAAGATMVVHDIPLLFEVGLEDEFDLVALVEAPVEARAERLAGRGLSPAEVAGLMQSQADPARVRRRADVVIDNDGSLEELRGEARHLWRAVLLRATGGARAEGVGGRADGRVRVDMHVHTRLSFDCLSRPDAVVGTALSRGLHRVCITDHNEIEAALELADRFPNRVIPGEEVKTREGVDIIGLYLSEWIPRGTPARETCERIRAQGGLVYVPHPFAGGKGGGGRILDEIQDLVHVVEGFNARLHDPALNEKAQEWGRQRGLPLGAGSDAHTLGEIGNGYVELPAFANDTSSFLAALPAATVHGREASRLVHLASTFAKLVP